MYMPTKKSRGVFDAKLKTCVGGVTEPLFLQSLINVKLLEFRRHGNDSSVSLPCSLTFKLTRLKTGSEHECSNLANCFGEMWRLENYLW